MKFIAATSTLIAIAKAGNGDNFGECFKVNATVFTDSDCATKSINETALLINTTMTNSCEKRYSSNLYSTFKCSMDEMRMEEYSSTNSDCSGPPETIQVYVWGECHKFESNRYVKYKQARYIVSTLFASALAFSATQF